MVQCIQSSFQFIYITQRSTNVTSTMLQCILLRGQIYGWDSGPMLHTNITYINKECSISQWAVALILSMHIMWQLKETISHFCDTLEIEEIKCFLWNFLYPDPTLHTLRLVSPWGCPGNPAYPTEGHPMAQGHTLLPNTLHTLQETTIQPREATLWPTDFRRPPYSQGLLHSPPSVP